MPCGNILLKFISPRWALIPRPKVYETFALPG
jgi:hypothetical protein